METELFIDRVYGWLGPEHGALRRRLSWRRRKVEPLRCPSMEASRAQALCTAHAPEPPIIAPRAAPASSASHGASARIRKRTSVATFAGARSRSHSYTCTLTAASASNSTRTSTRTRTGSHFHFHLCALTATGASAHARFTISPRYLVRLRLLRLL